MANAVDPARIKHFLLRSCNPDRDIAHALDDLISGRFVHPAASVATGVDSGDVAVGRYGHRTPGCRIVNPQPWVIDCRIA